MASGWTWARLRRRSLAAYCIGITGIDPLRYSRCLNASNPERISMPDFDIDFCYERRQEVIDYVVRKYGADHVAQIITFGTMAARGANPRCGACSWHVVSAGRLNCKAYAE
ncbi:MAG: hypothetical protein ACLVJ6_06845 [Merdibacter sp.]